MMLSLLQVSADGQLTFWNILATYALVIYEFIFELYLFTAIFTFRLNRRNYFVVRLLVGFVAMLIIGYLAMIAYHYIGATVWGRVLIYFILFVCIILHTTSCFSESVWVILLSCSMAYAAQNMTYKIYLTIWCAAMRYKFFPFGYPDAVFKITYYSFIALCLICVYFAFARRSYKFLHNRRQDYRAIIISLVILTITVILCSVEDVCFIDLAVGGENQFDRDVYYYIRQCGNLFSIACCVIVLLYLSGLLERKDLEDEIGRMQYSMAQAKQQYQLSKDTIEQINIKCHDMRHKVKNIISGAENSDNLDEDLAEAIKIYDSNIHTGNRILDVILTEKSLYCEKNGITLSCMVNGEKLTFIKDSDLYCLFGNIIDNAIDAVSSVSDEEKRIINLTTKSQGNMLIIQQDNYFDGTLNFVDGLPETTKKDKINHGYGMKSIRMITHSYGGEMVVKADNNMFNLSILLDCE